jgi:hypothetical protein
MTSTTSAGWHPDPYGRHQLRYFDGATWTENVSNAGVQGIDPPTGVPAAPAAQPAYQQQQSVAPKKKARWPWVLLGVFVVFGLGIVGCVAVVGTAVDHAANEIGREQERHAISQSQYDATQIGTSRATVLNTLGKQPEDTSSFSSQAGDAKVQSDCIYYWETGRTFGSWYQFCFDASGNLRTKSQN